MLSRPARFGWRLRRAIVRATLARGLDLGGWEVKLDHFEATSVPYQPCDPALAWRALRMVPRDCRATLVDFGCGRGVILHVAANLGFESVIGVEIDPDLADIARANLRGNRRSSSVDVVVADAARWQIPDDMTAAVLYCPFVGATFAAWLQHVRESLSRRPRPLTIVYIYPFEADQLLDGGDFRVIERRAWGRDDDIALRTVVFRHDP